MKCNLIRSGVLAAIMLAPFLCPGETTGSQRLQANDGNVTNQLVLGFKYWQLGNHAEAIQCFRTAAEQGYAPAQHNLGYAYLNGQGIPQDYVEAYKWFTLAAADGNERSVRYRDKTKSHMTPEQIAEGNKRAAAFVAKPPPTSRK